MSCLRVISIALCLAPGALACGSDVASSPSSSAGSDAGGNGGGGPAGGEGGGNDGGGPSCAIDPPGDPLSFVVRNDSTAPARLALGCGGDWPITIDIGTGHQAVSPGQVDGCEISCDSVYMGNENWGCSDCGPGSGQDLPPGGEATLVWDRRLYSSHTAPAACTGHEEQNFCALGSLVPSSGLATGRLTVCMDGDSGYFGWCSGPEQTIDFDLDLSQAEIVVALR